jgi:alpha-glucosidase
MRLCFVLLALLTACSSPPPPASYTLSDGTIVDVDGAGAVTLRAEDGHTLASTASGAFPVVRGFSHRVSMFQGFFEFRRSRLEETTFSTYEGSELVGDEVIVRFRSANGASARLRIGVDTPDVTTAMRLEVEGIERGDRELAYAIPFACDDDASFVGFGEQYNAIDQRGERFPLWTQEQGLGRDGSGPVSGDEHTTYFPMPWWIDWRGFGVLVETTAKVNVDLCATDARVAWVEVERRDPAGADAMQRLDTVVFHGPAPRDLVRQLGDRVGRPPMPPRWAFSPWIGMQGGRDAVLAEVAELEANDVPFSAVWVQDWIGGRVIVGDIYDLNYRWVADETLYPDLAGMVAELRARRIGDREGIRFLAYANPFVIEGLDHFDTMAAENMLPRTADGAPYTFLIIVSNGSVADFTSPATVAYVEGYLRDMVRTYGFDGWMSDFGEWLPHDAVIHAGDAALVHNDYPRLWHQISRDVMDAERPDGDWVVFSRSGWTGDQRAHQIVWVGDQEADWEHTDGLPTVVPAMLNLGLSAVPYVTHDIAGYSGGPSTKELYLRWTELGAFTTFMRTHEGLAALANWNWNGDAETIAHFRRFARIHEALVPELVALAEEAQTTSMPPLRQLALVFPDDVPSRRVSDAFMLGDTLLVAPVVEEGATRREVYLPPGTWFHVWTGTQHEGGRTITIEAPIGSPPVFSLGRDRPELRAIE